MKNENWGRSVFVIAIGVITPLFLWILLKSLANNSSSSHDPDPWIQSLVDKPAAFARNATENGWFKIVTKDGEVFWQKEPEQLAPLSEIPKWTGKTIFLVEAVGPRAASQLYNYLKDQDATKRVLLLSSTDGFLKDMQYYDGNLQMSSGQAYLIRMRMLKQLGLANLMKTNMSAVYLDEDLFKKDIVEYLGEFQKRRVPLFMSPKKAPVVAASINILLP